MSCLPSFVTDPLQGPFPIWALPWALMFPVLPLLGRKKGSRTAWYPRYDLRWGNTVWKNAGILVLSFPFQILQPFWSLMVTELAFSQNNAEQPYIELANILLSYIHPWRCFLNIHSFIHLMTILSALYSTELRNGCYSFCDQFSLSGFVRKSKAHRLDRGGSEHTEVSDTITPRPEVDRHCKPSRKLTTITSMVQDILI